MNESFLKSFLSLLFVRESPFGFSQDAVIFACSLFFVITMTTKGMYIAAVLLFGIGSVLVHGTDEVSENN